MSSAPRSRRTHAIEIGIAAAILLVSAGIVVPMLRTARIRADEARARADLVRIRDALRAFHADTGLGPSRGSSGADRVLFRLCGRSLREVHHTAYYAPDEHQDLLEHHLVRNAPAGRPDLAYAGWRGPYLDAVGPDPWGNPYVVVLYPMFLDDERDVVVVCSGLNGVMDSSYDSPRDPVACGDDLLEVVFDKSADRSAPLY